MYELCTVFNHHKSLNAFLDNLTLGMDNKDEEEGLVISTVHSAKGLEWEYVFFLPRDILKDGLLQKSSLLLWLMYWQFW